MRLASDDSVTHDIQMSQVMSVDYGDAATTAMQPPRTAPAGSPPARPHEEHSRPPQETVIPPTTNLPNTQSAPPPVQPPAPQAAPPPEEHLHPTQTAVTTTTYELAAGTEISVRSEEAIDSGIAVNGQTFAADVANDVKDAGGNVVIPNGANAQIVIKSATGSTKFKGQADLVLDLASVSIGGQRYALSTADLERKGREALGKNTRTAEFLGGGAAIGAIVGAIGGGGKGAAIGSGIGAGGGALTQALTKGESIKVPPDTVLTFKLDAALKVVASR
jgi:hypothetical protein